MNQQEIDKRIYGTFCSTFRIPRRCNKVLIIVDDITRNTPLEKLLRPIFKCCDYLPIEIIIALGSHRKMTSDEIQRKFKLDIPCPIIQHDMNDVDYDTFGSFSNKGSIRVGLNKKLFDDLTINPEGKTTNYVISIGNIVPHATTGFSGGFKNILPGCASLSTIAETHWWALEHNVEDIIGNFDNPVREEIANIGQTFLDLFIDVIMNGDEIYDLSIGCTQEDHRRGCEKSKEIYVRYFSKKANVVLAKAYPKDNNLRQAIKAICSASVVCEDGGTIILEADCPEGLSSSHLEIEEKGFRNPEILYNEIENWNGEKDNIFYRKMLSYYTLIAIGRIFQKKNVFLISKNISEKKALGFKGKFNSILDIPNKEDWFFLSNACDVLPIVR